MKRPSRFLRVLGAVSLITSLLVGAFGAATVSAQSTTFSPIAGVNGVFFPWVANDDTSTGLGPADTSVTIQNIFDEEVIVGAFRGVGSGSLPGDNGWALINPFVLEELASKTFSAGQLGIAEGEGAPLAFFGLMLDQPIGASCTRPVREDYESDDAYAVASETFGLLLDDRSVNPNNDADLCDYETVSDDDFLSGANSWTTGDDGNSDNGALVEWDEDNCLVVDWDSTMLNIFTPDAAHHDYGNGTDPDRTGANLDGNPANCTFNEAEAAGLGTVHLVNVPIAGVAKQAVEGENLPYTSEDDAVVSGYNGLAGQELYESGNTEDRGFNGWYLPIVQTNSGPGGAWNSIIRIANFGDGDGTIGAAGVNVTFYPYDDAAGELNQSIVRDFLVNAGQTIEIDASTVVPEGWVGSVHISADAPIFAMVDRVKVGYHMWLTNTASNALIERLAYGEFPGGTPFVLYAPDVRKDFFGWNTGINVANISDVDTDVTVQYYGPTGVAAQTREIHAKGMSYFYDPSQAPQDNNDQDPVTDPNSNAGEIGAAVIISDEPVVAVIDATKYPESTSSDDANVFQALSYSATTNTTDFQTVPLVQKGDPNTGMGATSGIQLFNPDDVSTMATISWVNSAGDVVGNQTNVMVNKNSMTFVYSMNDAQLPTGFLGSAFVDSCYDFRRDMSSDASLQGVSAMCGYLGVISTQVDYQVQFDGSAVWNGYNISGTYRSRTPR